MDETKLRLVTVSLLTVVLTLVVVALIYIKLSWILFVILGVAVVATVAVSAWFSVRFLEWSNNNRTSGSVKRGARVLTKFCYEDVVQATDNFSRIVGQGGSGSVFRGKLSDGTSVAVKRLDGALERRERVFRAELAAIGCVQHANLVQLYGHCIVPKGPRFLVYEYVRNGSLDRWIFPKNSGVDQPSGCLSWKLRYKVAIDVARGLYYLHNNFESRILHLDVKPENILLDENFVGIVSDFGLAKLMGKEENMVVTRIRGTREYLAPEWILDNGVSAKSDVYSYGLVLLEMIGGRRNTQFSPVTYEQGISGNSSKSDMMICCDDYFPKIVYEKMKAGKLMEVVDKRLLEQGTVDEIEVRRLVYVALWCTQEKTILRPNIGQVVNMLEGRLPVYEPPETKMFLLDLFLYNKEKEQGDNGFKATLLQISQCGSASAATTSNNQHVSLTIL